MTILKDRLAFFETFQNTGVTPAQVAPSSRVGAIKSKFEGKLNQQPQATDMRAQIKEETKRQSISTERPSAISVNLRPVALNISPSGTKSATAEIPPVRSNSITETVARKKASFDAGASNSEKCAVCQKTVYFMDKVQLDSISLHKTCLKCEHCKMTLKLGTYASLDGKYYCKPHFKQLFKLKGNYFEGFGQEEHKKQWQKRASTDASEN